jgi:hypothetical protein
MECRVCTKAVIYVKAKNTSDILRNGPQYNSDNLHEW